MKLDRLYRCAIALALAALSASASGLDLRSERIAGIAMQLPADWQRQMDDSSLILTESSAEDSPVLALFAVAVTPGQAITPAALADAVLEQFDLASSGIRAELIEERMHGPALFRLHRLVGEEDRGYLAAYTHTDPTTGVLMHMLFSATETRFAELGGVMLPLVAFAGMDSGQLQAGKPDATPPPAECRPGERHDQCMARRWLGDSADSAIAQPYVDACGTVWSDARTAEQRALAEAECQQSLALASQLSRMSHESTMSILYNMDSGWCYRGESDCH
jgi:hypothetical protein